VTVGEQTGRSTGTAGLVMAACRGNGALRVQLGGVDAQRGARRMAAENPHVGGCFVSLALAGRTVQRRRRCRGWRARAARGAVSPDAGAAGAQVGGGGRGPSVLPPKAKADEDLAPAWAVSAPRAPDRAMEGRRRRPARLGCESVIASAGGRVAAKAMTACTNKAAVRAWTGEALVDYCDCRPEPRADSPGRLRAGAAR